MTIHERYKKPLPTTTPENKPFWEYQKKHEFRVQKCSECGELFYPPSEYCLHCLGHDTEWVKLSGKGKVYSYVIVRRAMPAFADDIPYIVAIIDMEEGIRFTANVVGCPIDDIYIDMPVNVLFDDVTEDCTLPKFKPQEQVRVLRLH